MMRTLGWTLLKGLAVAALCAFFLSAIRYDLLHGMAAAAGLLIMFLTMLAVSFVRGWPVSDFNPGVVALRRQESASRRRGELRTAVEATLARALEADDVHRRADIDQLFDLADITDAASRHASRDVAALLDQARACVPRRQGAIAARKAARCARRRRHGFRDDPLGAVDAAADRLDASSPGFAAEWSKRREARLEADAELRRASWELHLLSRWDRCRFLRLRTVPISVLERSGLEVASRLAAAGER